VLLVAPEPLSLDVIAPVVLFFAPAVAPATLIEKLHEELAASVAPTRLMLLLALTAVIAPPPHDPLRPLGVATTRPDGNVSVNVTAVSGEALGLLIVKAREVLA
jgi:hypothetical protein